MSDAEPRSAVVLVGQETSLFHGTLAENLRLAEAARLCGVDPIAPMDALIGERGATLSGGRRARSVLGRVRVQVRGRGAVPCRSCRQCRPQQTEQPQQRPGRDQVGPQPGLHVPEIQVTEQRDPQYRGADQQQQHGGTVPPHSTHHPTSTLLATATTQVADENRIANARPNVPA
ncbi:hypothetical protein [Streptomyces sp. NPDC005009]